jgi:hypothetical protein
MIDPLVALAFSMHTNKGVYALLLGSGVSTGAGILTGWEIVLDLITKVGQAQSKGSLSDPEEWYRKTFNEEPTYSKVLAQMAKTRTERQSVLRSYIEPTEEDREQGLKVPSKAHKAIAKLVADGYIKVILTTNFDRLMEDALAAVGLHHSSLIPQIKLPALPLWCIRLAQSSSCMAITSMHESKTPRTNLQAMKNPSRNFSPGFWTSSASLSADGQRIGTLLCVKHLSGSRTYGIRFTGLRGAIPRIRPSG